MNDLIITGGVAADAIRRGLRPTDPITVSEWADEHRELSSKASSEAGQWRTARTPYLRDVMDCLSSRMAERIVLMFAAQLGKTEAGNNWIGWIIHHAPGPCMIVNPTVETMKKTSKTRINPLIEDCDAIRDLVSSPRSRDTGNTIFEKDFRGGTLMMVGANSAVGLRGSPVGYLFLDEVDGYPHDADGEGDPVALAIQRTANFPNRKILMTSTPTIKDHSRIEKAYKESDQRQFFVPCPECKKFQTLTWDQIKWSHGDQQNACCECIHCHYWIPNHKKSWMLPRGEWRAGAPGDGKTVGFHLNGLYAPPGWTTFGDIATEYEKVYKDPLRLKVWWNTKLGLPWEEESDSLDGETLMDRREDYGPLLPAGVVWLVCGVDVQGNRLELEVVGIGADNETWSIDYRIIEGDPTGPQVWKTLDALLKRTFPHSRAVPDMKISATCIDSGYLFMSVADYGRNRHNRNVWIVKGKSGSGRPVWPHKPNRRNKGKLPLYTIGIDACKEALFARLRIEDHGAGYCHFPRKWGDRKVDIEYFEQLTAEKVMIRYSKGMPIREWKKSDNDRNEALDCRVYAMAATQGLASIGWQINRDAKKLEKIKMKLPSDTQSVPHARSQKIRRYRTVRSR